MILTAEPLTSEGFASFGDVIEVDPDRGYDINDGYTTRIHALATAESDDRVILSIFQGRPRPLSVSMLERHPLGSQAFMPLGGHDWLAVVADKPEPSECRLFLCRGSQGLQYNAGVWHHPLLVLGVSQDFLVVDREGNGPNLEEVFFDEKIELSL